MRNFHTKPNLNFAPTLLISAWLFRIFLFLELSLNAYVTAWLSFRWHILWHALVVVTFVQLHVRHFICHTHITNFHAIISDVAGVTVSSEKEAIALSLFSSLNMLNTPWKLYVSLFWPYAGDRNFIKIKSLI